MLRRQFLERLALRLTNFLSESVGRRLMLSSPKVWENRAFGTLERPLPVSVLFASREGRQNSTPSSNARRPATRQFLEGHLLENPTLREMKRYA